MDHKKEKAHLGRLRVFQLKNISRQVGLSPNQKKPELLQKILASYDKDEAIATKIRNLLQQLENGHRIPMQSVKISPVSKPKNIQAIKFSPHPFYKFVEEVLPPTLFESLPLTFSLQNQEPNDYFLLYSCPLNQANEQSSDISFPSSFPLKVNGHIIDSVQKLLQHKSVKYKKKIYPIDITAFCHKVNSNTVPQANNLQYSQSNNKYVFAVHRCKKFEIKEMIENLKSKPIVSNVNSVKKDDDLVVTSTKLSLICPIGKTRIQTPCRSQICNHTECFDFENFLQLNMKSPNWICPVCNRQGTYECLAFDQKFDQILKSTQPDVTCVIMEGDGSWQLPSKEKESIQLFETNTNPKQLENVIDLTDDTNFPGEVLFYSTLDLDQPLISVSQKNLSNQFQGREIIILESDDEDDNIFDPQGLLNFGE